VFDLKTMVQAAHEETASDRILTGLFSAFAAVALLLATTGLYALISYSVSQRQREIGVRMALGASAGQVRSMIVGQGARLLLVSLVLGLLIGFGFASALRNVLFGVTPTDPTTYALVIAVLLGAALLASLAPALRASRVDPIQALRAE
jgi:ABC-type antimicrobial peptide transport system permease subunit